MKTTLMKTPVEPMVTLRLTYSEARVAKMLLEEAARYDLTPGIRVVAWMLADRLDEALCVTLRRWTHPVTIFFHRLLRRKPAGLGVCIDSRA
jgi:hypothetical protein